MDEEARFARSFDVALGNMQRRPNAGVESSRCLSPAKCRVVGVGGPPGICVATFSSSGVGLVVVEDVPAREG